MNKQNIYFIILIAITGILSLLILSNFIIILVLAYIFGTLVRPSHKKIEEGLSKVNFFKKGASTLSSVITIILFLLIIVTPISIILGKVIIDTQSVYQNIVSGGVDLNLISQKFRTFVNAVFPHLNVDFNQIGASVSGFFVGNIGSVFTSTVDVVLKLFLFILAMFYFLKDGKQFGKLYSSISPLKKDNNDKIFDSIKVSINSIMIGSITVAATQGVVTGIGLWIFGVPNPFFFGTLAGFLSLIPSLGAPLVWIPSAIYLYFTNPSSFSWLYLVLWGSIAVGLIDNLLGPKVINKGIKIHPLFILLSILGGISIFGLEGFILGPLVLSIFVAIVKVWNEGRSL